MRTSVAVGIAMLIAPSVSATEVEFSIENRIGGDTNVLRQPSSKKGDGFVEIVPRVSLRETNEELTYDFWYTPIYQAFFQTESIDGWDHATAGRLEWLVTPRDTIGITERFTETRIARLETNEVFDPTLPATQVNDRERIRRTNLGVYYTHAFTPIISGRVQFDFSDIDYQESNNVDTRAFGGSLSSTYALNEKVTVGVYGSGRYRQNLGTGLQSSSTSAVGNVALSISADLSETLEFFVQAGPSIIRTMEEDRKGQMVPEFSIFATSATTFVAKGISAGNGCTVRGLVLLQACPFYDVLEPLPNGAGGLVALNPPPNASGQSATDVTYFAEVRLTKRWKNSRLSVGYTRSESGSAGIATSSVIDSITAWLTMVPGEGWKTTLQGGWSQRETVSPVQQTVVTAVDGGDMTPNPAGRNPAPPGAQFAQANALATVLVAQGRNQDVTAWNVSATAEKRLTKQISLVARVWYTTWTSQVDGRDFTTPTTVGYLGIQYTFEPLRF